MYISQETPEQTNQRLLSVLKTAEFRSFDSAYCFRESSIVNFSPPADALAMIRDEQVWSYLVPAQDKTTENFKIFSFHFRDGLDNSGFVGWLASRVKQALGAGLFVVCGQNSARGGIFDYWGCPVEVADEVEQLIQTLRN